MSDFEKAEAEFKKAEAEYRKAYAIRKNEESRLCLLILNGNVQAVQDLLVHIKETVPASFAIGRIEHCINRYSDNPVKLCEEVLTIGMNRCPKCASSDLVLTDYDPRFRDGNLVCSKCNTYVRGYDAG